MPSQSDRQTAFQTMPRGLGVLLALGVTLREPLLAQTPFVDPEGLRAISNEMRKAGVATKLFDVAAKELFDAAVKASEARVKSQMQGLIDRESEPYTTTLGLEGERKARLEALGKKAVEATLVASRLAWQQQATSRSRTPGQAPVRFSAEADDFAPLQPVWTEGLKQLFSAEELQRVQGGITDRRTRFMRCLAKAALALMDRTVCLDSTQRVKLEPLIITEMASLIKTDSASYWRVQPEQLLLAARNAPPAAVRGILDEKQLQQWKSLRIESSEYIFRKKSEAVKPREYDEEAELPDVETEIARYLHRDLVQMRTESLQFMSAQVEDAQRVLRLPPEKILRLTTAAKGAVEAATLPRGESLEKNVRAQARLATPRTILAVLANVSITSYYTERTPGPESLPVWRDATAAILSPPQLATWQQVKDDRAAYRTAALAAMTTLELDRRRQLSAEQFAKVERLVTAVLEDYLPDIERFQRGEWHLSSYSSLMPLGGVKEAEMKAVLTPTQWKQYRENDIDAAQRYWQSIEQWRKIRLREEDK